MRWIDGHLDFAYIEVHGRNMYEECVLPEEACISYPDLIKSPIRTFLGTICTYPKNGPCGYSNSKQVDAAFRAGVEQLQIYERFVREGKLIIQHEGCNISEHLSTLLLMEGADPIRNADDVLWWRDRGLRAVGLTWSIGTRYAGGNAIGGPVTEKGIELIEALDEARIVHDASHLSDEAFDDVMKHAKGTVIASHSNSRKVLRSNSQRHLRDDQAKEIFRRGGVIGLNLYSQFLSKDNMKSTIHDCVDHVMHFCELAGNKRQVALGSDFDGGFSPRHLPTSLKHPVQLPLLAQALLNAGFNNEDVKSFAHGAWKDVFSI